MASDERTKRSHRLRTRDSSRDLEIKRGETSPRTNRARTHRTDEQKTRNRFRVRRYRMAASLAVGLGMSVLIPMTYAKAPTPLRSRADGVAGNLEKVLPHRLQDRDAVQLNPLGLKCPQYRTTIRAAGFTATELKTVDAIIHRESRCQSAAVNTTLNRDKSHDIGLTQINNRSWCLPTRYYPKGYLQTLGIIKECEDLLDPLTNLEAAYQIFIYAKGFSAWQK